MDKRIINELYERAYHSPDLARMLYEKELHQSVTSASIKKSWLKGGLSTRKFSEGIELAIKDATAVCGLDVQKIQTNIMQTFPYANLSPQTIRRVIGLKSDYIYSAKGDILSAGRMPKVNGKRFIPKRGELSFP